MPANLIETFKGKLCTRDFTLRFVLSLAVSMLLSVSSVCSQEAGEKGPADKGAPEQNAVEKARAHSFGGPCELTTCVTRVLYFSNLSQPNELQDFVNALRTIAEISRVQQIPAERVVIVRATPDQVALAEKLADEIDKAKRRFGGAGYRLDFKVSESEGDKKLRSRVYSLVTEAHDSARLTIGRQAPPSQSEADPGKKQSSDAVAGRNIECRILAENERSIELQVDAAFSSPSAGEAGRDKDEDEKAGLNGMGRRESTQLRLKDHVTVELGKPTVISVFDDPDIERTFQIELTAIRIKDRQ
jgi:hypothetical protein